MISPSKVSAVLVTKGDVDLSRILESVYAAGITDMVVWDNSERENLSCYGRYEGIDEAKHDWIYHQDDDLVAPVADILACVDPKRDRWTIVANNRPDEGWPLTAMGVVFHRSLAECFDEYHQEWGAADFDDFCRVSDVVFAYMNAYRRIWVGYADLPWQTAPDRMHLQRDHYIVRERARLRTLEIVSRQQVTV